MRAVSTVVAQCPPLPEWPPSGRGHPRPTPPETQPVLVAECHLIHKASDLAHSCGHIPPQGWSLAGVSDREAGGREGLPEAESRSSVPELPEGPGRGLKSGHAEPSGRDFIIRLPASAKLDQGN